MSARTSLALALVGMALLAALAQVQACDPYSVDFDHDMAARGLLYSIAAYYPDSVSGGGPSNASPWSGQWCDLLDKASSGPPSGTTFPVTTAPVSKVAMYGGIAADGTLVVAFRGTAANIRNWVTDLDATRSQCLSFPGEVHDGFCDAYRELRGAIGDIFDNAKRSGANPSRVIVTGHSLGAAVATLAVAEMLQPNGPAYDPSYPNSNPDPYFLSGSYPATISLVTFGSPRVGNRDWADATWSAFEMNGVHSMRFINGHDIVPGVPPRLFSSGYTHVGTGLHLVEDGKTSQPDICCNGPDTSTQENCQVRSDNVNDHSSINGYWPHFSSQWPPSYPSWLATEDGAKPVTGVQGRGSTVEFAVGASVAALVVVAVAVLLVKRLRARRAAGPQELQGLAGEVTPVTP